FSVANEITVMVDGRIIATGSPDDIRNNQQAQQAYLGEPGLGDA
ncbi:MAG: ABC transporter ATP-binding protein, partial [Proteobacteria bacterium]|nr:ABC transporter ATP-binding protein [Pseudomonadota bacterium]